MSRDFFTHLETCPDQTCLALAEVVEQLAFNDQGLIPVITQDAKSKTVLMLAWMNKAALQQTLATGRMVYWSRSRQTFWEKGATSGHTQQLQSIAFDCDGDTLLCQVIQTGAACHTGRPHCFYLQVNSQRTQVLIQGDAV